MEDVTVEDPSLSTRLRDETLPNHRQAERHVFVRRLMQQRLSIGDYVRYLRELQPVYRSLESGLRKVHRHPKFAGYPWPELFRSPRITSDLGELVPAGTGLTNDESPYALHIDRLTARAPLGLLGHAYCRYMGDLSGGAILARRLRLLGIPAAGLSFYNFGEDSSELVTAFRRHVDRLTLTPEAVSVIVGEAKLGFGLTVDIFTRVLRYTERSGRRRATAASSCFPGLRP